MKTAHLTAFSQEDSTKTDTRIVRTNMSPEDVLAAENTRHKGKVIQLLKEIRASTSKGMNHLPSNEWFNKSKKILGLCTKRQMRDR